MDLPRFLAWIDSIGISTEHVDVRFSDASAFGLYSRGRPIERDYLVLSVPEQLFIKPSFGDEDLSGFEQLIVRLIEDRANPYIAYLRTVDPVPKWVRCADVAYPRQLSDKMRRHSAKYNQSRNKLLRYELGEFQWAYYIVNSRSVHLKVSTVSNDENDNLCLIPYLDFINHSTKPNTTSKFNSLTQSYEVRALRPIAPDEQITFLYNPHSNVDLFVEYGFVLETNRYNKLNVEHELESILSRQQIQLMKSYNYWSSLELYPADSDLSWTLLKAVELADNERSWSPYDDPPKNETNHLVSRFKQLLDTVQQNTQDDFRQWTTDKFSTERSVLYRDSLGLVRDASVAFDRYFTDT